MLSGTANPPVQYYQLKKHPQNYSNIAKLIKEDISEDNIHIRDSNVLNKFTKKIRNPYKRRKICCSSVCVHIHTYTLRTFVLNHIYLCAKGKTVCLRALASCYRHSLNFERQYSNGLQYIKTK